MMTIKTRVVHSESKNAWNVIGTTLGAKYKIARVPYDVFDDMEEFNIRNKAEALEYAEFISYCFNNADKIQKFNM